MTIMGGFHVFYDTDKLDICHGFFHPIDRNELGDFSTLASKNLTNTLEAFSEEADEILRGALAASFPGDVMKDADFRRVFPSEWLPAFHGFNLKWL